MEWETKKREQILWVHIQDPFQYEFQWKGKNGESRKHEDSEDKPFSWNQQWVQCRVAD